MLEEISESIKYGMSDVSSDECSFEQEEVVNIEITQQEDKQVTETIEFHFSFYFRLLPTLPIFNFNFEEKVKSNWKGVIFSLWRGWWYPPPK